MANENPADQTSIDPGSAKPAAIKRENEASDQSDWARIVYARALSAMVNSTGAGEVMAKVCDAIVSDETFALAWVGVFSREPGLSVEIRAKAGAALGYLGGLDVIPASADPGRRGPVSRVFDTGAPCVLSESEINSHELAWRERAVRLGIRSLLAAPLKIRDRPVGVLMIYSREPEAFTTTVFEMFRQLAAELAFAIDLDEQRLSLVAAEAARRSGELQYRRLFDHAPDGFLVGRGVGCYLDANPSLCRMLGYSLAELRTLCPADVMLDFDERSIQRSLRIVERGDEVRAERRLRRKDGSVFVADLTATLMTDGCYLTVVRDVSKLRHVEASRRQADLRYRQLFEHSYSGLLISDGGAIILDANPTLRRIVDRPRADLIGRPVTDFIAEEDWPVVGAALERLGAQQAAAGEVRLLRRDGGAVPVEFVSTAAPDGTLLTLVRDLTDRKRLESVQRAADQRYRQLFEYASDGIIIANFRDGIVDASPSFCRLVGLDADQIVGRRIFEFIHPDDFIGVNETVEALDPGAAFHAEARVRRADGTFSPVEYTTTPTPDGQLMSIVRDVSGRKRAEAAEVATAEALLETRAQLARMARVSNLGEMVATISHEINQPLAAVVTNTDAALRWLDRSPDGADEARAALKRIGRDAVRASDVIKRTRVMLARGAPKFIDLDLNAAIEEVVAMIAAELKSANVAPKLVLLPGLGPVRGDRIQIQQVLINLLLNAIDALRPVSERPRRLCLATEITDDHEVLVTVEDNGEGLPAEAMGRIFEHLFTTKAEGTGLGLAISKSIVEIHGGRIWAGASASQGARFHFTLPMVEGLAP